MRTSSFMVLTSALLCLASLVTAADRPPQKLEHPSNVALVENSPGPGLIYKHFPTNLRLYIFDGDKDGKSGCIDACAGAWPPLIVPPGDDKKIGDWKPILRDDGRLQWSYKGHPVYVRYHDSLEHPMGDGFEGKWHFLTP